MAEPEPNIIYCLEVNFFIRIRSRMFLRIRSRIIYEGPEPKLFMIIWSRILFWSRIWIVSYEGPEPNLISGPEPKC